MVRVVEPTVGTEDARLDRVLAAIRKRFSDAGIAEAALDARILITGLLDLSATDLIVRGDSLLDPESVARIENATRQRLKGRPVHRILGWREFYGRRFALSSETLEPRPDTETLVEAALEVVRDIIGRQKQCMIADLGVGTGVVGLSILAEIPECRCLGFDIAPGALETARANAIALGLAERYELRLGNWLEGVDEIFDVIVSNPPYIGRSDMAGLDREVREHDPSAALDGGIDGLDAYRTIAAQTVPRLAENGVILLELGIGQNPDVAAIFNRYGLRQVNTSIDMAGLVRVASFKKT